MKISFKKSVLVLIVALLPSMLFAAGGNDNGYKMAHVEVRLNDEHSLQNGARIFVNNCLSCHSAKYMRYNRMAEDLNIPEKLVLENMIFSDAKIGDTMTTNMPADKAAEWFGVAPPDLSLTGRLRDASWLYNYFLTFYVDETTESGWNNLVFENAAMPHVLADMQGRQRAIFKPVIELDSEGKEKEVQKFSHFEAESEGIMSPEEFANSMRDLTAFLVYVGEPAKMKRVKYGVWVMIFLVFFGFLAYLLKKEYWRDVDVSH